MTDHSFRYAVWSAVSSDEQVHDKDSLDNQIRDARAYAERFGGAETHEPFIADGYSRSFYEGLSEAMEEIPPLRAAIQAAERNEFDVLIVRYFERLGSVAYPVFLRLGKYRKQLRSVQEATAIVPPALYDPTKDEATSMMIHMSSVKQDYRINRIISNLRDNMPRRIREGLTPSRIPYGYVYQNNKMPPVLDPSYAAKLIQARDMLMRGESLQKIGDHLGIHRSRVPTVLGNPYYMGQVTYSKTYIQRLGTKRSQIPQPKSKWLIGQGKHTPVFTRAEHEEIMAELDRREDIVRRRDPAFVFSGLLRCAVCGDRARRQRHGFKHKNKRVIVCRAAGAKHILWNYDEFFSEVARQLQAKLQRERDGVIEEAEDKTAIINQAIEANKRKREKIHEGYEAGLYTATEASKKLKEQEREEAKLQKDLERATEERVNRREARSLFDTINLKRFSEWLSTGDPKMINRMLVTYLKEIRVGESIEVITR